MDIANQQPKAHHSRVVKAADLERYKDAEFVVNIKTGNKMRISDIFTPVIDPAKRRAEQLSIAIHQALHGIGKVNALADKDGRILTELKFSAETGAQLMKKALDDLKQKEQAQDAKAKYLQEWEDRLKAQAGGPVAPELSEDEAESAEAPDVTALQSDKRGKKSAKN